jgi:phosphatidylinositol dimannoside acyltransferase
MTILTRLRHELHDLFEMVLVPAVAVLLPWPLCYRLFRWLCRFDVLYRHECRDALAHASARSWVRGEPAQWLQTSRLVTLIDHADFFLSRTRSQRWMARHLEVQGQWPAPNEAALLCTFHWGAGMWALRHAGSQQLVAHAIVAPHSRANFAGRTVRYLYYGARNRENTRALGTQPIQVSASPRPVMQALRAHQQVMAAIDVPADQVAASELITLLGLHARVPRGLFRIAAQSQVPLFVYITGIRMHDGKRTLSIARLPTGADQAQLMQQAFALLEAAITENPAAWHFWKVAPRFFCEPSEAI